MSTEVGSPVTLRAAVRDAAGALTAATVTIVITKPDGTTLTPAVDPTTTATVGRYEAVVTPDQAGTWLYRWVVAGAAVPWPQSDQFSVVAQATLAASLDELKAHLNMTSATDSVGRDMELRKMLAAATRMVEARCGPVSVKTFTEPYGRSPMALANRPVVSITTVTPRGGVAEDGATAVDVWDATTGVVELAAGSIGGGTIVYRAGRTEIPENLQEAALIIAAHLWTTQRGVSARPGLGGDDMATPIAGLGYALPNRAEELMAPDAYPPAVA